MSDSVQSVFSHAEIIHSQVNKTWSVGIFTDMLKLLLYPWFPPSLKTDLYSIKVKSKTSTVTNKSKQSCTISAVRVSHILIIPVWVRHIASPSYFVSVTSQWTITNPTYLCLTEGKGCLSISMSHIHGMSPEPGTKLHTALAADLTPTTTSIISAVCLWTVCSKWWFYFQ